MGALFGKLPDMGKSFEADLTRVDPADANFYVIIRQTIQGLDTLILNVTLQGSTFLFVFLGVAGWLFERKLCLPVGPAINLHLRVLGSLRAVLVSWLFLFTVSS
jgi:hypothetical protein